MRLRSFTRRALALALVTLLLLPATFAFAGPTIPDSLHLVVTANGRSRSIDITPTPTANGGSSIDTASVTSHVNAWVASNAAYFAVSPVNATRKVNAKKRRIEFKLSKNGSRVDQGAAVAAITTRLLADAAEATPSADPLSLPMTTIKPKVTGFRNSILVSLRLRKIWLYRYTKVIKTYRCAVGQPRYPTPTGLNFYIGKKVKNPSWTNGGMQWAAHMPSYIGPGPNNPLGTRAMYVYGPNGDTGVRFHGVPSSENSSIGHAASHGCLRMHRKDVEDFFKRVNVGTAVYIIK